MTKQNKQPDNYYEREKRAEDVREMLRKQFDFGDDYSAHLETRYPSTNQPGKITRFYTSRIPKLQIKSSNSTRIIDVELSSAEEDNEALLHYLFTKSKE